LGEVSIARIADECGLSASYFVRAFRETTGMPPYKWLTALRIEKVKALLATSSEPLNEIALACGFADQSHMGRAFLKHTGLAPGQWRRRYR
jgi:AraC-like DNA-binding protein